MVVRNLQAAAVLAACLASTLLVYDRVYAQSNCGQDVVDRIEREQQAFKADVDKQNADFLINGAQDAAIADASKVLKDATKTAAQKANAYDPFKAWLEEGERITQMYQATLADLGRCLESGPPGCLLDFAARQNEAFKRWMNSFLSEGTQTAIERVKAAESILQNHVTRLASVAQGDLHAAVASMNRCLDTAKQQQAQAVDTRTPEPTPTETATPKPPEPPKTTSGSGGGMGAGTGIALLGGAIGGGLIYGLATKKDATSGSSSSGSSGGSTSGTLATIIAVPSSITCRAAGAGFNCTSNGQVQVRTDSSSLVGRGFRAMTESSGIGGSGTFAAVGGTASVTLNSAANTFSCPPTQTRINIFLGDGTGVTSRNQSIPVSCQ